MHVISVCVSQAGEAWHPVHTVVMCIVLGEGRAWQASC